MTKRSRDLTVLIVIVALVGVGFAAMITVSLLDTDPEATIESDAPPSLDGPAAVVHESLDEACAALEEAGIRGKRSKATAAADQDELVQEYLVDPGSGPAVGIGLTICGRGWVVVVGARSLSSVLPAFGPRGTPVIAHFQPPFVAD